MTGAKLALTGTILFALVAIVADILRDEAPAAVKVSGVAVAGFSLVLIVAGLLIWVWTS